MTVLGVIVLGAAVCGAIRALGDATAKVIRSIKGTEEPMPTIEEVITTQKEVLKEAIKPKESNEEEEP